MNNVTGLLAKKSLLTICLLGAFGHVQAADNTTKENKDSKEKVEKITITGSRIKKETFDATAPIVVISRDEFLKTGAVTAFDALVRLPEASFKGNIDAEEFESRTGSNPNVASNNAVGASTVSLRDLGYDSTLILINGRRVASHGLSTASSFSAGNETSVVALNNIPVEAIERIEILKSGASAIYGSEAMAGVINIILRKTYDGTTVNLNQGISTEGDASKTNFSVSKSFGRVFSEQDSLALNLNLYKQDRLMADRRENPYESKNSSLGTANWTARNPQTGKFETFSDPFSSIFASATASCDEIRPNAATSTVKGSACFEHTAKYRTLLPESDRASLIANYQTRLSSDLELFSDLNLRHANQTSQTVPIAYNAVLASRHPFNPSANRITLATMLTDAGPVETNSETFNYSMVAGLSGVIKDYNWQMSVRHSGDHTDLNRQGQILKTPFLMAVTDGSYKFGQPGATEQSVLASFVTEEVRRSKTSSTEIEASLTGQLLELPSGSLDFATGLNYLTNTLYFKPDELQTSGQLLNNIALSPYDLSRETGAAFAEFAIPVLDNLELDVAGRLDYDQYFGQHVSPQLNGRYEPFGDNALAVRFGLGEGYRAPTIQEYSLPDLVSESMIFLSPDLTQFPCAIKMNPALPNYCVVTETMVANKELKPQTSLQKNLGLVINPLKDLSLSWDYFVIERENEIRLLSNQYLPEIRPDWITLNDDGEVTATKVSYHNFARTLTQGYDLAVSYDYSLGHYGKLSSRLRGTRSINLERQTKPSDPIIHYAGYASKPKWAATADLTWEIHNWTVASTFQFIDKYNINTSKEANGSACDQDDIGKLYTSCEMPSYTTVDLMLQYRMDDWKFTLTGNNIFDRVRPWVGIDYKELKSTVGSYYHFNINYVF